MGTKRPIAKPFKVFVYDRHELVVEMVVFELPLMIGRHSQADISLKKFRWVSRQHAVIQDEGGRYIIHDLKSKKGMDYQGKFVNSVEIIDGTKLSIGNLDFVFEFEEGEGKTVVNELDLEKTPVPPSTTARTIAGIPSLSENTGARQVAGKKKQVGDADVMEANTVIQPSQEPENSAKDPVHIKIPKLISALGKMGREFSVKTPLPLIPKFLGGKRDTLSEEIEKPISPHSITIDGSQAFTPAKIIKPVHETGKIETNTTLLSPPSQTFTPRDEVHPIVETALAGYHQPFDFARKGKSRSGKTSLEAFVTWKEQVYDIHGFLTGESVIVGPGDKFPLSAPVLKNKLTVANVTSKGVQCRLLNGVKFKIKRGTEFLDTNSLNEEPSFKKGGRGGLWNLGEDELLSYDLGHSVELHLRKVPATKGISVKDAVSAEKAVKDAVTTSTIVHLVILALAFIFAPTVDNIPKLDNVPKRYAKLLVKPTPPPTPEPTPTPTPPQVVEKPTPLPTPKPKAKPTPKPKKVVQKRPKIKKVVKKVIRRPKQVVVKQNRRMKDINQYPLQLKSRKVTNQVDNPVVSKPEPKPVNVQSFGALAALGAITPNAMPQVNVQNVKINQNAGGGQTSINTGQVIGALKAKGGQLPVGGGSMRVATTGKGYGTGSGYGVQGSRGLAGQREVAGAVGTPKLYKIEDSEGLTQKQVMAIVKQYIGKIQQCYERALLSNPDLSGRVEYEWLINPSGDVEMARVKKSEISSAGGLNNCVTAVFKGMKFPVAKNGQTTRPNIGFPFGRL